jgi:hypothetical protein
MKVVLTLLVRDEGDVLDANLRHHLALGIDHIVVTDHGSTDATPAVLERHRKDGMVSTIREDSDELRQSEWVTRMARLAATEQGADWVINCDADEFWWPRDGSLHDLLAAVPARFGALRALWRNFVPRPDDERPFFERMTVRRSPAHALTDPFHAQVKVVHRGHPDVVVTQGNHDALGPGLALVREWLPFEILHFPVRDAVQAGRKFRGARDAGLRSPGTSVPQHTEAAAQAMDVEGDASFYERLVVADDALPRLLAAGELTEDTRLRDELRDVLAGRHAPPPPPPRLRDDVELATEAQAMLDHDTWVKLDRRADALQRRISTLEGSRFVRAAP